jgi:RNA polymerase sigma-70 factor (sigma-E family)
MEWTSEGAAQRQFDAFVAGATDGLFRTAYLMSGDTADAEDLVQETFIRVARHWTRVRSMEHPTAYARRTLVNLAVDGAKRRSRQRAELRALEAGFACADENAARALREIDDLAEFRWALAQVPPGQRAVLVLRYWEDLAVAEVAEILGCSAGTVKSAASRGAARLARALASGDRQARASVTSAAQNGQHHDH